MRVAVGVVVRQAAAAVEAAGDGRVTTSASRSLSTASHVPRRRRKRSLAFHPSKELEPVGEPDEEKTSPLRDVEPPDKHLRMNDRFSTRHCTAYESTVLLRA